MAVVFSTSFVDYYFKSINNDFTKEVAILQSIIGCTLKFANT